MTDLSTVPEPEQPSRNVGYGNAMFLADLAEGMDDSALRQRIKEGAYPHLHTPSIDGWRQMAGRTSSISPEEARSAPKHGEGTLIATKPQRRCMTPTAQIMTRSEV